MMKTFLLLVCICFHQSQSYNAGRGRGTSNVQESWQVTVNGKTYKGTGKMPDISTFMNDAGDAGNWDGGNTGNSGNGGNVANTGGGGNGNSGKQVGTGVASTDFVKAHNDWRRKEGENLPDVKWDSGLAALAKENVKQCVMKHDYGQTTSAFTNLGQNLFMTSEENLDIGRAAQQSLKSWMSEKQYYTYADNACSDVCGHYTQVVWKSSTSIGCAVSQGCGGGTYIACNYGPAGNFFGRKPY